jgi:hypothetical protein
VLRTLAGWTIDGAPVTADRLALIAEHVDRRTEAAQAAIHVWVRAGFFGVSEAARPAPVAPA